jgi:hypothetical protein
VDFVVWTDLTQGIEIAVELVYLSFFSIYSNSFVPTAYGFGPCVETIYRSV